MNFNKQQSLEFYKVPILLDTTVEFSQAYLMMHAKNTIILS